MAVSGRLRHRLVPLLRSERGQALPTALFAMIASFALASAAVLSSVDVQQGSARDHSSKEAIAAADAGAGVALLRLNRFQRAFKTAQCVGPGGEAQTPSGGWCPATTAEGVGGSTFTYQVSAYEGEEKELSVVAVGTAGSVSRRVEVGLASYGGPKVFAKEHAIGQSDVSFKGANGVKIETDIGTNGNVESNSGNVRICGNIRHGNGKESPVGQPEPSCGTVSESNQNLPGITPPGNLWTPENSDCRLVPNCVLSPEHPKPSEEVDTYTISVGKGEEKPKTRTETDPWYATGKKINVGNNANLTMGGFNYLVCGLKLEGSGKLIMAANSEVRIFVDTPEHCGLAPGTTQVEVIGNASIVSTGYNPAEGKYAVPEIYLLGNGSVNLSGNGTNELLLYAPESNVEVSGNATWIGDVAGKSLNFSGSPTMESKPGIAPPGEAIPTLWERTHYVECTGTGASTPNASC